jgi:hypothetical protein
MGNEPRRRVQASSSKPSTDLPDRVWLTLERKYRVAEYESLTVSLGASTSVDPGENLSDASKRTFEQLKSEFYDVVDVMRSKEGL